MANWFDNAKSGGANAFYNYVNFMNSNPVTSNISRVAGNLGGYQPLEAARDFSKGNIAGGLFNTAEGLIDVGLLRGVGAAGVNAARTGSVAGFKPLTKGILNKLGITSTIAGLFNGPANATPATNQNMPTTQTTAPTVQAPDFANMTQAQKLDWIAKNDINSANFNAVYANNNRQGALEKTLMNLTDPMVDLQKRTALREADQEFQRVKNMLEGAQAGLNTQYTANKRDTNQQTTGSTLDQRAALASLGQGTTGLVGLGAQSIATEGNRALAQLAAAKAKQDQNIVDAQSNADIARKEARKNAIQAWGAGTNAYRNQLMRDAGIL